MNKKIQSVNKHDLVNKSKMNIIIVVGILMMLIAVIFIFKNNSRGDSTASAAEDLIIAKSEITETAKFFPLKVGRINMEVLAVRADDGSIRTAFNTCQVCNGSPRAYYKQQGDALICQNCGNRFNMNMVERERGGCNPIPIMSENKTDDGINIVIPKNYIGQNVKLFTANWKTK